MLLQQLLSVSLSIHQGTLDLESLTNNSQQLCKAAVPKVVLQKSATLKTAVIL